jgi:hypothetical protein
MSPGSGATVVERREVRALGDLVVRGADERAAEPRQREDPAPAPGGHDGARDERQLVVAEGDVGPARGADDRDLGLVMQLLGPQAVGPHARWR